MSLQQERTSTYYYVVRRIGCKYGIIGAVASHIVAVQAGGIWHISLVCRVTYSHLRHYLKSPLSRQVLHINIYLVLPGMHNS